MLFCAPATADSVLVVSVSPGFALDCVPIKGRPRDEWAFDPPDPAAKKWAGVCFRELDLVCAPATSFTPLRIHDFHGDAVEEDALLDRRAELTTAAELRRENERLTSALEDFKLKLSSVERRYAEDRQDLVDALHEMQMVHAAHTGRVQQAAMVPPVCVPPETLEDVTAQYHEIVGHGKFNTYRGVWRGDSCLVKVCDSYETLIRDLQLGLCGVQHLLPISAVCPQLPGLLQPAAPTLFSCLMDPQLALTRTQWLDLCVDVATAVEGLHDRGLVHRDIRLDNVLVFAPPTQHATLSREAANSLRLRSQCMSPSRGTPFKDSTAWRQMSTRRSSPGSFLTRAPRDDALVQMSSRLPHWPARWHAQLCSLAPPIRDGDPRDVVVRRSSRASDMRMLGLVLMDVVRGLRGAHHSTGATADREQPNELYGAKKRMRQLITEQSNCRKQQHQRVIGETENLERESETQKDPWNHDQTEVQCAAVGLSRLGRQALAERFLQPRDASRGLRSDSYIADARPGQWTSQALEVLARIVLETLDPLGGVASAVSVLRGLRCARGLQDSRDPHSDDGCLRPGYACGPRLCMICLDNFATVLTSCGHAVACDEHLKQVQERTCPLCNDDVGALERHEPSSGPRVGKQGAPTDAFFH